jgi:hypothetical protein
LKEQIPKHLTFVGQKPDQMFAIVALAVQASLYFRFSLLT